MRPDLVSCPEVKGTLRRGNTESARVTRNNITVVGSLRTPLTHVGIFHSCCTVAPYCSCGTAFRCAAQISMTSSTSPQLTDFIVGGLRSSQTTKQNKTTTHATTSANNDETRNMKGSHTSVIVCIYDFHRLRRIRSDLPICTDQAILEIWDTMLQ